MVLKYSEEVLDHFRNPRNAGEMDEPTICATEGSLACGDMMSIYLKIEEGVIREARFESYGCAANIATGSVLTEMITGMSVEEAEKLTWNDIVEALGGLPQIKFHCSTLSIDTLRSALKKYREMEADGKLPGEALEMRHSEGGGLRKKIDAILEERARREEGERKEE